MEIIHADSNLNEVGFIDVYIQFDSVITLPTAHDSQNVISISVADTGTIATVSATEAQNDFQLDIDSALWEESPINIGDFLYIDGTEFGGRVESVKHITRTNTIQIYGTSWRGMLAKKIVSPPAGSSHKTITGMDANAAIAELIGNEFDNVFAASTAIVGVNVTGSFRYTVLLDAITRMLSASDLRLELAFNSAKSQLILSAEPVIDRSDEIELSQDYDAHITTENDVGAYNHIIALGQGELLERTVIELWRLDSGVITDSPGNAAPRGLDLRTMVYNYPSVGSADELTTAAREQLERYAPIRSIDIDLDGEMDYPLGDYVGVRDRITGMAARRKISQKILTMNQNGIALRVKTN